MNKIENILVTVLLITYNHREYIEKALESILSQKTNFKYKILIADDCSNDGNSEICQVYAEKYPEIIEFTPRSVNLGVVNNIYENILKIKSKYFATIEGDDYWCNENKLQKQVDILETNLDCSFCGHNTLLKKNDNTSFPIFNNKDYNIAEKYSFPKSFNKKDFVKIHPSSRLYRTSCIDFNKLKMKDTIVWDSSSFWYFLTKGNLFYLNEVMSVYNYTEKGIFSGSDEKKQKIMAFRNIFNINKEFNFKYNHIFSKQLFAYKKDFKLNLIEKFILEYFPITYTNKLEMFIERIK